jgi:hypothetical protein
MMILCAPCTQGWHNLIKKVLMFSQIGSWHNYTCPNKTTRCSNEKHW